MSVYEDIQDLFEKRESALSLQFHLLAKAAGDVAGGLRVYLGLPSPRWNYADGKAGDAYVRLGVGQKSQFEEKPWMALSSQGGVVPFTLSVCIHTEDRTSRAFYFFSMSVRFCDDGYLFEIEGDRKQVISVDDVKAGNLAPIYDMIVAQLKAVLDPERILIKN